VCLKLYLIAVECDDAGSGCYIDVELTLQAPQQVHCYHYFGSVSVAVVVLTAAATAAAVAVAAKRISSPSLTVLPLVNNNAECIASLLC
jgi:hypothetical protein